MQRSARGKQFQPLILSGLLGVALATGGGAPSAAQTDLPARQDVFLAGYVSAVLERDFALPAEAVSVRDGVVTLRRAAIAGKSSAQIVQALEKLKGVRAVRVTESDATAPAVAGATAPARPAAEGIPVSPRATPAKQTVALPPGKPLFDALLADPRWAHFSASYQYYDNDQDVMHAGSTSFGETFSLLRGAAGEGNWELGFQAGVFALFDLDSESKDLVNADYWVGVPLTYRHDNFSAMARLYHQSSHLGDEYLLRERVNRNNRVNLSYEAVDLLLSYEFDETYRVYGGGGVLFNQEPTDLKPWSVQYGVEITPDVTFLDGLARPVLAADLHNREENDWSTDLSLRGGIEFTNPVVGGRRVMLLLEYYSGRNPNGQFYTRRLDYAGIGLHVFY